jgi:hypothetical protein
MAKAKSQSLAQAPTDPLQPVVFYVASSGNDAWTGKQATPNSANTDGPFATIARARNAIRELKRQQGGVLKQPVTVFLRGGTYFIAEPLVFTPEDSGTADSPIAYAAYQDEKPIISGGRRIAGWKTVTRDGKQVWAADLPEVKAGKWFFRQLWVNGERRTRARHPNKGYFKVAEVPDATAQTPWHQGQRRFKYREGDLSNWKTVQQAEVVVTSLWAESRLPVAGVDESQRIINFGKASVFQLYPESLYYIEHAWELLDAPGEWYLDKDTGTLYYIPMPDEGPEDVEAIAPVLPRLLELQGNQAVGQFIDYLSFRGLTFYHTEWQLPADASGYALAAIGVPGAIYGQGIRSCTWDKCEIAHISNYGIELYNGCYENRIFNCKLFDLGAGGIKIGDGTHSTEIRKCSIYKGGCIFHNAAGIILTETPKNKVYKNLIYDFYYTAISTGWVWGYGASKSKENIIELNHIHHIGQLSNGDGPILNELAGIYILGQQPGTIIRSNIIHNITALGSAGLNGTPSGMGFFLDEGVSYLIIENNLVYQTDISFHLHYGKENIVRNNIFALGNAVQISRIAQERHLSFTLERNIIYWRDGQLLAGNWSDSNFALERNLYWRLGGGEIRFKDLSWDAWRAKGIDKNSMLADPLFVAPERGDFRLKPNSPAFKLGFQPIALQAILEEEFSFNF